MQQYGLAKVLPGATKSVATQNGLIQRSLVKANFGRSPQQSNSRGTGQLTASAV